MPSHELERVVDLTRQITHEVIAPHASAVDREGRWPEPSLRTLQKAGLGGLVVPRANGGLGLGLLALAQVCEIIGKECASTALCFGMHCVGSAVIAAKATPFQQQHFLEPIVRGEHLTTLAISEPGSGSHLYLTQTECIEAGSGQFRITGTKAFVTSGGHADSYVISVMSPDSSSPGEFSCLMVPGTTPGLIWGEPWAGIGMRGNASRTLDLRATVVPGECLLGEAGDQLWYVFEVVAPYFLMAMAGTYLGLATAALDQARGHLTARRYAHNASTLSQQPVLQHRLGDLWAKVERTRRLIYHAATEGDYGGSEALPAIMSAKAEVADCVVDVTNAAMTLMGGIGYRESSLMDRYLRDARAAHVMTPTTDLLRLWTGRTLLGQPLLGE